MIIKRRYVPFWILRNTDEKSNKVMQTLFKKYHILKDEEEHLWQYWKDCNHCLAAAIDIGSGVRNPSFISKEFDKLDKVLPYENDYNLEDVNGVEMVDKGDGWVSIIFTRSSDGFKNIIQVIKIRQNEVGDKVIARLDNKVSL